MQTNQITPRMAFTNLLAENRPQAMAWGRFSASRLVNAILGVI